MENGNLSNLEQMNNTELKQYLAQHRNDDAAFSQALAILISRRAPDATRYSGEMSLEEIEKVIKERLDRADR
ncbi:hypothetical protein IQ255_23525 [Pleurocapsales cyanobacterium LEGE 10410]|nr:hypothetical protein [Pleurocapsales cyanobacterium LEGE 10410]